MTTFFCLEFMFGNEVSPPLPPFNMISDLVFLLPKHGISLFSSYYNSPEIMLWFAKAPQQLTQAYMKVLWGGLTDTLRRNSASLWKGDV